METREDGTKANRVTGMAGTDDPCAAPSRLRLTGGGVKP